MTAPSGYLEQVSAVGVSKLVSAILIALLVVDLPYFMIDFLSLPLPTTVLGMPWAVAFGVAALVMFWPSLSAGLIDFGSGTSVAFALVCMTWFVLEGSRYFTGDAVDFALFVSMTPALLGLVLVSHFEQVFGEKTTLIDTLVAMAAAMALGQLTLFALAQVDLAPLGDFGQKNRFSILIVAIAFAAGVLDPRETRRSYIQFYAISAISLLVSIENEARAALISLIVVFFLHLAVKKARIPIPIPLVAVTCVALIVVVTFAFPILEVFSGFGWFGGGDERLSTIIRAESNWKLVALVPSSPVTGIGWAAVRNATASGYVSHTLYSMILSGYGLIGLLSLVLFFRGWLKLTRRTEPAWGAATLLFLTVSLSFFNDPAAWQGLLLALSTTELLFGAKANAD